MDIRQIEYFVHVAELGSFTKAASLLSIAQPALSRQVRSLEVELAQALLYRNGRGVSPTEAGKRLLAHGRGILLQVERARQEVEEMRGAPVGRVVVGAPPTVGNMLAVPLASAFQSRFPRAMLGIVEGLTGYVAEWLLMGRVDIAVLHNPVASPALTFFPLMKEHLCLISPLPRGRSGLHAPVRVRDLPGFPLIMPSRPHAFRMQVDTHLAALGLKANVVLEIDGVPAMLDLVHQGYGHAVLPANRVSLDNRQRAFATRPIVSPRMASMLNLAVSAQRPATPLTRQTQQLLEQLLPQVLHEGNRGAASNRASRA